MNFADFKKVSEDKNSATLKHPKGHKIVVAKNALSPKMRSQLSDLPVHMESGGMPKSKQSLDEESQGYSVQTNQVQPNNPNQPIINVNVGQPQPSQQVADSGGMMDKLKNVGGLYNDLTKFGILPPVLPNIPESAPMESSGAASKIAQDPNVKLGMKDEAAGAVDPNQPAQNFPEAHPIQGGAAQLQPVPQPQQMLPDQAMANDRFGTEASMQNTSQGIGNQIQGIQNSAAAQGELGRQQAQTYDQNAELQQSLANQQLMNQQYVMQEHQNFLNDMANDHVDPNKYIHNMSGGQKFMTAIGLLLGGMGSGLAGGSNPAQDFLNKQISNDIEAQKENFGRKKTMLEANMKYLGDMGQAINMTRVQLNEMTLNRIQAQAAKMSGPVAQAQAQKAVGDIQVQNAQLLGQIVARRNMIGGNRMLNQSGQPASQEVDPSLIIQYVAPEKDRDNLMKELGEAQAMVKSRDNLLDAFDFVAGNDTVLNRVGHLGFTPDKTAAAFYPAIAQLAKDSVGKFTEQDFEVMKSFKPSPGDLESTVEDKKRRLKQFIDSKLNFPSLKPYGIEPMRWSRFGAGGDKKLQLGPVK